MPAPPMPHTITIHSPLKDENNEIVYDSKGRAQYRNYSSKARVKETNEVILTREGQSIAASLELTIPSSTLLVAGDDVEWTNPETGANYRDTVETVKAVLSYSGKVTYFRKAYTLHKGG